MTACCPDDDCCRPQPISLSRRGFLALSGAAGVATAATLLSSRAEAARALGVPEDCVVLVPADKGLTREWIASLYHRGAPTVSQGDALGYIGMPVGGGCCGELYLGGDGRLWRWDILNEPAASTSDTAYANPPVPSAPFHQGFTLRTEGYGDRTLDADGFDDVRFTGQYPIGTVHYRADAHPVEVTLEAFSPFVPLATSDSTIPATVMVYTLRNTSHRTVSAEVVGTSENPVCLRARGTRPIAFSATAFADRHARGVQFAAADATGSTDDVIFEDWHHDDYTGWTVEGTAFGAGPVRVTALPALVKRFGDLNVHNGRLVTSYAFRDAAADPDGPTGKLMSAAFTVTHDYIETRVSGGNHPGQTCVNVVVDGTVVATATGTDTEPLAPVVFDLRAHRGQTATIEIVDSATGAWGHVSVDRILFTNRPDIVFENFERTTYDGWTVQGNAFGAGPVTVDEVPDGMKRFGGFNAIGQRFVTSYNYRGVPSDPDSSTGTLTSQPFTVSRRYLIARVGGGNHPGETCLNVLVDGKVVASFTGASVEPMTPQGVDLSAYQGKQATVQIVDNNTVGWGHVNVDSIVFSDRGMDETPLADLPEFGTFALAALDSHAVVQDGTVRVPVRLRPGASAEVRFLIGWYFPTPDRNSLSFLTDIDTLRRHYAPRYSSARDVVTKTAADLPRLEHQTRLWTRTWYDDSTLPHWFLERTFATASTIATSTCYQFDNGRFYGWEGVYCCAGTCEHVWNYAQSVARLFPNLERDTRERVDLDIGFHADTGQMGFRAEADTTWATDGECGTVLRIYREHQLAPDDAFLQRNWARTKLALQFLMSHDTGADGIIDGPQPNTLDQTWYGEIAWISGMYVAALRAGAQMADEVGDSAFAQTCQRVADRGTQLLSTELWTGEYFIQKLDPAHTGVINSNTGCHIDQMFGQALAAQVGLPRVFDLEQSRTALQNIYRYNFAPDPADYRARNTDIPGARIYAEAHEPAVLMTTWPHCGAATAAGSPPSWAAIYFNENWTGQEYQLATQMMYDDVVEEGLIVTRAVHDRYAAAKRNPYNEIECGEHYARAMAGYGVFLGACGFEHHGPAGHIGFAPRLSPDDFAAAFTAASGWGLFRQQRHHHSQTADIELRYGQLRVSTLALETAFRPSRAVVRIGHREVRPTLRVTGDRVELTLTRPVTVTAGETLSVRLT
ncbi:MAG TPA: GH116 family glycosyl hydrolase [Jatrophihabitantaceae bacterium]